jgi:hypothetical protein
VAAPADAGKRHKHKPSGVEGVVFSTTCAGPCTQPPPQPQPYTGPVTVTVTRVRDSAQVASQTVTDGRFRMRVRHGIYEVSAVPPNPVPCQPTAQTMAQVICPPPCQPTPQTVCPLESASSPTAIIAPCLTGDTQRVGVRRHRFTHVELHVTNVCVV